MIKFMVRNDVGNAKSKSYYFESITEAVEFAQKKCKKNKRDVIVMDCEEKDGLFVSGKKLYIIKYINGGITRERVRA